MLLTKDDMTVTGRNLRKNWKYSYRRDGWEKSHPPSILEEILDSLYRDSFYLI